MRWLGSIPAHWNAGRLKEVIRSIESGVSVNATDVPAAEGAVGVLKTSCVYDGTFRFTENKAVVEEDLARVSCPVAEGTLIVSRMNTPALVGAAGLVTQSHPNIYLPDRLWQVSLSSGSSSFLHYWTLSGEYRAQVEVACSGTSSSMQNLGQDQFKNFQIALPAEEEQRAIATFLDRETAKIDALIAEQEKLLALLAEKRQATISHAVTRGLNPNAPMKDSGIPWLGEVPEHWEVGSLKRFWSVTDCKHLTAEFIEDGIPLASIREVQSRFVDLTDAKRTTESFFEQLIEGGRDPRAGDLLFSRNATVGEVAQVPSSVERFAMGQDVCLLRRLNGVASPDYMQCVLRSPVVAEQLDALMIGSTFKRINVEKIRSLAVPFPPVGEQLEISSCLEKLLGSYDSLAQEVVTAVALLKERRSALISAAVTGKIDVRNAT